MTDPINAIELEVAKALVQAGVNGLTKLLQKVPALFKRHGRAREQHVVEEIDRTVTRLQAVTGSELERERARQEAGWEVLLRGLLAEHPDAAVDLKALATEINATLADARPGGGVVGVVNASRDAYVAGRDITVNHHPDRGDSQLELSAITVANTDPPDAASVLLDLKLRNTGGQPAILHRATFHIHDAVLLPPRPLVGFSPHEGWFLVRGSLEVSHTYDINLPLPTRAAGSRHDLDLSQAIEPAGTDRFRIRLGIPGPLDTIIYLLHFDIHYDKDRTITAPAVAIGHPPWNTLETPDEIRSDLRSFRTSVRSIRDAIDREMTARGLPTSDWDSHPPARRADLPPRLLSVDGDPDPFKGSNPRDGFYRVRDTFWNPDNSVTKRLDYIHTYCTRITNMINGASICQDSLPQILAQAQAVLEQMPALRAEFGTPEFSTPDPTDTRPQPWTSSAASSKADVDKLIRLMVERSRERDKINPADQVTKYTELVADRTRVHGPDHEDTLSDRGSLAYWIGRAGDPAGAAETLAELVADRTRVNGPDSPYTLHARGELADWRGKAGDPAGAAEALAELVADKIRLLGSDDYRTRDSQRALGRWQDQAGQKAQMPDNDQ